MIHWTAREIERLMHERGLDRRGLAVASEVEYKSICGYFVGHCLLRTTSIEKLLKALGHELEIVSDGTPNPAVSCLYCGVAVIPISIHGHTQCPKCQAILERCCED